MPFVLIRGTYHPGVGEPDGDSVRFAADDVALWSRLDGRVSDPGTNDTVQLRFEGIDAIEKTAKQPLATQARDSMFGLIGSSPAKQPTRGYILSRAADPHGRPIVFAFAGDPPESDGSDVFIDAMRLRQSVNFKQTKAGFAYPLYYNTLFRELREQLNRAVDDARANGRGYWPTDKTKSGVTISKRSQLATIPPIWPKIWRRLEEFLRTHVGLAGFLDFIESTRERADNLVTGEQHSLDNFIAVSGNKVRLLVDPKNLRVISR